MKIKLVAALVASSWACTASAQYMGTLPPVADAKIIYTEDTDQFRSRTAWIGANIQNGAGLRIGNVDYVSPNMNADGTLLQGTYINVGENHSFHGALGAKSISHRSNSAIPSEHGGTNGYVAADAELRLILTDSLSVGASVSADLVESERSIQTGTTYVYTGGDIDLQLSDNINVSVIVSNTSYSDDNTRMSVRSKVTWTFLPEYGVSAYVKTKNQTDSNPGSTNYFSPVRLNSQSVGLQYRKYYGGLVFTAGADYGVQNSTAKDDASNSINTYSWQLGVQTQPGKKYGVTYGVMFMGSNYSMVSSSSDYNWLYANAWIKVPF